jgi:hypothetical protein
VEDYYILFGLVMFLVVYFLIDRKNLKGFFWKDPYEQFNAVRLYLILIIGIIVLTLKVLKPL